MAWFGILAFGEASLQRRVVRESGSDARLITNFGLGAIGIGAASLVPVANVGSSFAAQLFHTRLLGAASSWPMALVLTVVGLTLVSYWTHRAMHSIPLLWRVHRVHHADTSVDVSTSLRHHPLEMVVAIPADALVILLVGAHVPVVVAAESLLMATAFLGHADIHLPLRLDRALAWVVVTPRLHRLHHHPERRLHDSNYGDTFTLWDRLFGTFSDVTERLPVGLDRHPGRADHLVDQILSPIHAA